MRSTDPTANAPVARPARRGTRRPRSRSLTRPLTRPLRRAVAATLAVALLGGVLAACSSGGSERLTIYSGRNQELIEPLLEQFADDTGIGIDVRYGDSADLALLIDEEGDQSPADVFLSQSPGAMGYLDASGRLQELDQQVLDLVPERFRAEDGHWVGVSGRVRVLVYDPDDVADDELPGSVFDVTAPRFAGQVGVAPTNASFQDFVTAMRELEGEERTKEWLEGLVANDVKTYPNNLAIVEAVARGEIRYGLVNDYYLSELQAQDPDITARNHYFPDGDLGSLILATTAGVLDTADDPGQAEQLIEYLLSRKAQEFYAEESFEYPLARGVPSDPDKPALSSIVSPTVDLSSLGDGLIKTRELIADSGLQ